MLSSNFTRGGVQIANGRGSGRLQKMMFLISVTMFLISVMMFLISSRVIMMKMQLIPTVLHLFHKQLTTTPHLFLEIPIRL